MFWSSIAIVWAMSCGCTSVYIAAITLGSVALEASTSLSAFRASGSVS